MCYSKELIEYWSQHLEAYFFNEEDLVVYQVIEGLESAFLSEVTVLGYLLPRLMMLNADQSDYQSIVVVTSVASSLAMSILIGMNPVQALSDTLTGMSLAMPRDYLDQVVADNQDMINQLTRRLISIRQNNPLILGGDQ
jgi:hypothetical protein